MPFGFGGSTQGTVVDVDYRERENQSKPWAVVKNGAQVVSRHRKKSAAERKAKRVAKGNKPAELNVYTKSGSLSYGNQYSQ